MCGICGELLFDASGRVSPGRLGGMLDAMVHRGPDDEGTFSKGPVALGMRRLSIIDLEGGQQPIFSEDRTKVVVCNGEIYNYVELRAELQARGHTFRTQGDTEVIIHLYEEKGPRCVEDLNGMFAFAVWDETQGQLLLARDRIGIKPLHYYVDDRRLLFASEINALRTCPEVPDDLDAEALDDYLTFFYIPGTRSIYRSISKVPPAHTMLWRQGRQTTSRYWQLQYGPPATAVGPIEQYAEQYRHELKRSVRLQLRSDVSLGVFLSGGLDSGSLVAAIARTTGQPCKTFTVGFKDASYDESACARMTSEMYGTEHHEFRIGPEDLLNSAELIGHFGEPFGPFTTTQAHAISNMSRHHVTVALAGDGGDELFGGYQTYIASRMARHYLRVPKMLRTGLIQRLIRLMPVSDRLLSLDFKIREFVRGAEMYGRGGNAAWKVIFTDEQKGHLLTEAFRRDLPERDPFAHVRRLEALVGGASGLQKGMYVDLSMFLPDCVLTQTDRMSMAVSQEVRVPILDHELVEFAAGVPDRYKLRRGQTKRLVRHALVDWLPEGVINRPKTGFTTPAPVWIRGPLKQYVTDVLSPAAIGRTGLINPPYVKRLLDEHIAGRADHARRIWSLVHFVLWHEGRPGIG